jgi:hypothetical protein
VQIGSALLHEPESKHVVDDAPTSENPGAHAKNDTSPVVPFVELTMPSTGA